MPGSIDTALLLLDLHPLVTVVVVCPFDAGIGVVLSCPVVCVGMAPLPFCQCTIPVFAVLLTCFHPTSSARGGGVLVAVVVVFASLPIPVPAPLSLSLAVVPVVVLIHYPPREQVLAVVACVCVCCLGTVSW